MSDDYSIKYNGDDYRLSDFVREKVSDSSLHDFNFSRVSDALSQVNAWNQVQIVLMDDDSINYYEVKKVNK